MVMFNGFQYNKQCNYFYEPTHQSMRERRVGVRVRERERERTQRKSLASAMSCE